jgi:SET domain-containing protein 6
MISESLSDNWRWAPYFAVLPKQLHSLVFWAESELAELQASTVTNKIGKAKAEELFSKHIAPLELRHCDLELCHKVASIIMAYAFDIPEKTQEIPSGNALSEEDGDDLISDDEEDEKTILSMIPLADMLNADAERNNARLCCDNEDLEMRAIKPILQGEEIFNDYGQLPQSDLLRRYGYVTEHYAMYDVAELSLDSILHAFGLKGNVPLLEKNQHLKELRKEDLDNRIRLAEREGVCEESYDFCHGGKDNPSIPDELLALLYLLLLNEESFTAISDSKSQMPSRSKMTTELVGHVLVALIDQREREYATTAEEDEEILLQGDLTIRKLMAVQVRHGEKKVLRAALKEARSFTGSNKRMRGVTNFEEDSENGNRKRKAVENTTSKKKARSK